MRFRHLLEKYNNLGQKLFEQIREELSAQDLYLKEVTIVDASIIQTPGSTRNRHWARDPEMTSTRKGNQYYFGMKLHIGVGSGMGLIHSLHTTSANVHDMTVADRLLHDEEKHVHSCLMQAIWAWTDERNTFTDRSAGTLRCVVSSAGS